MLATKKILLVSPKPPPWHGGAVAAQMMLDSPEVKEQHDILHLDAKFADSVSELSGLSLKKIKRLGCYLWKMASYRFSKPIGTVVLTPTFYFGSFMKDSLFLWLAWALGIQNRVAWFHMSFVTIQYENRGALAQWYIRKTLLRCNHFIIQSEALLEYFPSFIDRKRCQLIPNGVDGPEELQRESKQEDHVRVLYISNMDEAKGWRVLFAAAGKLIQKYPDKEISVHFFGGATKAWPEEEIRGIFAAGESPGKITYGGFVSPEEKALALTNADIFVLPSFNEALPLTVLEAMAYGVPVIASDVGAVKDALIENEGGLLVLPNNEDALYEALSNLVGNRDSRVAMSEFNRARFLTEYTRSAYGHRWSHALKLINTP